MKSKNIVLVILAPSIVLAASLIAVNKFDPSNKTDQILAGKITKRIDSIRKVGPTTEITVQTKDGNNHRFVRSIYYYGKVGDKVKLRLYKRKISGIETYRLEQDKQDYLE
jgi:hypothetical protein